MGNRWRNSGNSDRLYFGGAPKSLQMVIAAMKLRHLLLGRKVMTNLDSILKSRDIKKKKAETLLCQQDPSIQSFGFSSSHVWM